MKLLEQHLLTENDVIDALIAYLKARGWKIESHCKGYEKGTDIVAIKNYHRVHVEAKGAKANKSTRRKFFDRNQIRSHLGVAILKCLQLKAVYPQDIHIIAQPHTEEVIEASSPIMKELRKLGIHFVFVHPNGQIQLEELVL